MEQPTWVIEKVDPIKKRKLLSSMHKACFPEYPMIEPIGDWWLVKADSRPAAFCVLWQSIKIDHAGYLARAGVLEKYRGHGLQKRMIRLREREARRRHWKVLVSDSNRGNVASGNSLISCGYRMWNPPVAWGNENSIYWRRELIEGAP